jgi:outer membrane lipopolysaccharide assembly protein LptE/RlpB
MRLAIPVLVLVVATSCGYTAGQITSGEGRTVAIPMFQNMTYRRDLERDLTRFVRDEITARTSYTVAGDPAGADVVVVGKLMDVEEDVLSDRSKGRIRESSVAFTVELTITDRTGGESVVTNRRIIERAAFVPMKGESIRSAEIAVMRKIGERVVYSLESEW